MKKNNGEIERDVIEIVGIAVSVFVLVVLIYSFMNTGNIEDSVFKHSLNPVGIILLTGFLDSFPNLVSSFFVMISAISAGMNIYSAIGFSVVGSLLGSLLGFFIGRKYLFSVVRLIIKKKDVDRVIEGINKYGQAFLLLAAIAPLPYLPMIFGAIGIKWEKFFLWGVIPRICAFLVYGYGFTYLV
ncbi:hypothetical protein HN747_01405 [archaeon]|jgi:membrane protein YqaA with SNARE-associated domain|nr:hypothetical protein [archaeon]